jgi:Tfp pilus assembly protein FimV
MAISLSANLTAHGFSVGEIELQSRLGMPFVAEVPLQMKPHERGEGFVVVVGDEADYEAERLPRAPAIADLWPTVLMGPPDIIRIVSKKAMGTAQFDLVLLVRTGQVTIVRNYAIALPPPPPSEMIASHPSAPVTPRQLQAAVPASDWTSPLPARYGPVLPGESLYKIMKRLEVPEPLIWPVAVLTWKHNAKRFVRDNMHGLRSGAYLDLPPDLEAELQTLHPGDARELVADQWDAWRQPRRMAEKTEAASERVAQAAPETAEVAGDSEVDMVEGAGQAVVLAAPTQELKVSATTLESMLKGLESRLAQQFSLPDLTPDKSGDNTVTFVSTGDLHSAIQGLETRLTQQFEQVMQQGVRFDRATSFWNHPELLAGPLPSGSRAGLSVSSLLSAHSITYILVVQNLLLLLLALGIAWRWYRKRA